MYPMSESPDPHTTLHIGEPHPSCHAAADWLRAQSVETLATWQEAFSSNAIEGNRLAEICAGTLTRWMSKQPVSDRYLLGLAWAMRYSDQTPA